MKRILVAAVALICTTMNVAAQQKTSTFKQKAEQLMKDADAAPQDWRKQYDAGNFLISIDDTVQSQKYALRALDLAQKMEVMKDTILPKSLDLMAGVCIRKNDYENTFKFFDLAIRAYVSEFGYNNKLIPPLIANIACFKNMLFLIGKYAYGEVECIRGLREAFILNSQLPEGERATGMEEAETVNAIASELLLQQHKRMMKDKVWLWTNHNDGKTYTILAFDDWTLEQPDGFFPAMMKFAQGEKSPEDIQHGLILMDEQGKVTELEHGDFTWNVFWNVHNGNFSLEKNSTIRLTTVSPERRQQMIDALNGRRQQIMEDFKKSLDTSKITSPTSISPGALNINKKLNNGLNFRFGK